MKAVLLLLVSCVFCCGQLPPQRMPLFLQAIKPVATAPPAYPSDSFVRANGALGVTDGMGEGSYVPGSAGFAWHGSTWGILGNKATNSPTMGTNVIVDGDFSLGSTLWNLGTGWTTNGSYAQKSAGTATGLYQLIEYDTWFKLQCDYLTNTANTFYHIIGSSAQPSFTSTGMTVSTRKTSSSSKTVGVYGNATFVGTIDNVSANALDITNLITYVNYAGSSNVNISCSYKRGSQGFQGGIIACLATNAYTNFIVAYHGGTTTIGMDTCINGKYTNVITFSGTYADNKTIRLINSNNITSLFYDGSFLGAYTNLFNWGTNTSYGLFATSTDASFTNFVCKPL